LNRLGLDPLLPMTDYLLESFGPFDLIPAPELELADESEEWRDTWDDSYTVTADLLAAAARAEGLKAAKKIRRGSWLRPDDTDVLSAQALDDAEETNMDKEKREKMTKTLAYLHSRGVQTSSFFERSDT